MMVVHWVAFIIILTLPNLGFAKDMVEVPSKISSSNFHEKAKMVPKKSSVNTKKLPMVTMFYHIPKTAGTSIRKVMSAAYLKKFPWGSSYSNYRCGIKYASIFHLTYDEMISCGIKPIPGPSLCVVRDPQSRFESEVRWRVNFEDHWLGDDSNEVVSRMINECEKAKRHIKADTFSHCQPQSHYLYKGIYIPSSSYHSTNLLTTSSSSSDKNDKDNSTSSLREPVCDYLISSNLIQHDKFLKAILGSYVPKKNISNRTENGLDVGDHLNSWTLKKKEIDWIHSFYKEDYNENAIRLALEGNVLRKKGNCYIISNKSNAFDS
mmetsp:Transcript_48031/g.61575  ORF Transcript_48031/g.61575 Transcript_48031/m.61575 type:complete len:321 (+) Transcript_48031:24-986(+)